MKLLSFKIDKDYIFDFNFENGIQKKVDISSLIKSKVAVNELDSAHIDKDWGCLEFKNGLVDIDPLTLYKYVLKF